MAEDRSAAQDRQIVTARDDARARLAAMADRPDDEIDLAEAALALSVLGPRAIEPNPYREHLAEIAAAGSKPLFKRPRTSSTITIAGCMASIVRRAWRMLRSVSPTKEP